MPKSPTRPTQYPSPQWARELQRGKPRHSCRGGRPLAPDPDGAPAAATPVRPPQSGGPRRGECPLYSAPRLPTGPWWLLARGTGLFVAVLVVRVVPRQQVSRYRLMSLLGVGVGLGIVLWRMAAAFAKSPALQTLALQSGGAHVAFFAGVLGLGVWYG